MKLKNISTLIVALFVTSIVFAQGPRPSKFVSKSAKTTEKTEVVETVETTEVAEVTKTTDVIAEEPAQTVERENTISLLHISYDKSKLYNTNDSSISTDMNGFTIGFMNSFNTKKDASSPLYIDWGLNYTFGRFKDEDLGVDDPYKFTYLAMNMPIGLSCRARLSDKVFLVPKANLNLCLGMSATEHNGGNGSASSRTDYFSKDDMGDNKWSRFQVGCNFGVAFEINSISLGINYKKEFTELTDNLKHQNLSFVFGILL